MKRKAQSLVEYSVLFMVVAAALMSMQVYMKRGLQAAVKVQSDRLGPQQRTIAYSDRISTTFAPTTTTESKNSSGSKVLAGGTQTVTENGSDTQAGTFRSTSVADYRRWP